MGQLTGHNLARSLGKKLLNLPGGYLTPKVVKELLAWETPEGKKLASLEPRVVLEGTHDFSQTIQLATVQLIKLGNVSTSRVETGYSLIGNVTFGMFYRTSLVTPDSDRVTSTTVQDSGDFSRWETQVVLIKQVYPPKELPNWRLAIYQPENRVYDDDEVTRALGL
jgi:hypothetical protein